jgi:hypothetical protein
MQNSRSRPGEDGAQAVRRQVHEGANLRRPRVRRRIHEMDGERRRLERRQQANERAALEVLPGAARSPPAVTEGALACTIVD